VGIELPSRWESVKIEKGQPIVRVMPCGVTPSFGDHMSPAEFDDFLRRGQRWLRRHGRWSIALSARNCLGRAKSRLAKARRRKRRAVSSISRDVVRQQVRISSLVMIITGAMTQPIQYELAPLPRDRRDASLAAPSCSRSRLCRSGVCSAIATEEASRCSCSAVLGRPASIVLIALGGERRVVVTKKLLRNGGVGRGGGVQRGVGA